MKNVPEKQETIENDMLEKLKVILDFVIAIVAIVALVISFMSFRSTLDISQRQLRQSEQLYELQNRPFIYIENAEWYGIDKTLAGDTGLKFPITFTNNGKSPAIKVNAVQHMVLIIKTETITRYPNYVKDTTEVSEQLDVAKDKRIVQDYIPYRQKPFKEISKFISSKKGSVTKEDIKTYFSVPWAKEGYTIQTCGDLEPVDFGTIFPDKPRIDDRGRSLVSQVEQEILKPGGDILLFYYAIEYHSYLGKKYVTNYIGCYDSFYSQDNKDKRHFFTYNKLDFSEGNLLNHEEVKNLKEPNMENFKIWPDGNRGSYLFLIIGIALSIRVILCLFKVCAIRQGEAGEDSRDVSRLRAFFVSFFSWGHNSKTDDYWLSFFIGLSELFIYPTLMLNNKWIFIGTWIGIKTASTWGVWVERRTPYNRFLFGNILALFASYLLVRNFF